MWDKLPRIDQASLEKLQSFQKLAQSACQGSACFLKGPGMDSREMNRENLAPGVSQEFPADLPGHSRQKPGRFPEAWIPGHRSRIRSAAPYGIPNHFPMNSLQKPIKTPGELGKSRGQAQGIPAKIIGNPWGIRPKTNSDIET